MTGDFILIYQEFCLQHHPPHRDRLCNLCSFISLYFTVFFNLLSLCPLSLSLSRQSSPTTVASVCILFLVLSAITTSCIKLLYCSIPYYQSRPWVDAIKHRAPKQTQPQISGSRLYIKYLRKNYRKRIVQRLHRTNTI